MIINKIIIIFRKCINIDFRCNDPPNVSIKIYIFAILKIKYMKTSKLVIGKSYKIYSKYLGYRGIGVYTHRTKFAFHFKRVDINYTDIFVVSEVHELVKDL